VQFAGVTDIGRVRETNEDSYCLESLLPDGSAWLLAVADGLGGCRGGEVASRTAIVSLLGSLAPHASSAAVAPVERVAEVPGAPAVDGRADGDGWRRRLEAAILEAHARILREAAAAGLTGMGTTLTAAVVHGDRCAWGHVGDSRAYLLRAGRLRRLTSDHSVAGQLVAGGLLAEEAARHHPQRHVLTQALGFPGHLQVETGTAGLEPGDWLILATDGLAATLGAEEIAEVARGARAPLELCRRLVALANERGGPDNITVLAARA
jgi:serine/threonine protein phosphatase PrpC